MHQHAHALEFVGVILWIILAYWAWAICAMGKD